jgi:hypothetical protein
LEPWRSSTVVQTGFGSTAPMEDGAAERALTDARG